MSDSSPDPTTQRPAGQTPGVLRAYQVVATVVGLSFGRILGGSVIAEQIFNWPGMGSLLIGAIPTRDLAVVQGVLLVYVCWFVAVMLVVDLCYAAIDPRVRLAGKRVVA